MGLPSDDGDEKWQLSRGHCAKGRQDLKVSATDREVGGGSDQARALAGASLCIELRR